MPETLQHSFTPEDESFLNELDHQFDAQLVKHLGATTVDQYAQEEAHPDSNSLELPDFAREKLDQEEKRPKPSHAEHLLSLPQEGFTAEGYKEVISQLLAIGLPPYNYTKLGHEENKKGTENVMGSYGIGDKNRGEFKVYGLRDKQGPEERLKVVIHEATHGVSVLDPNNAEYFGGEEKRVKAEAFARNLAKQSNLTQTFINGYHKMLAKQYTEGKITEDTLAEELHAIALETAMTDPAKLRETEALHKAKMARMAEAGALPNDTRAINIVSYENEDGEIVPDGIDIAAIALLEGVEDVRGLDRRRQELKERFYDPKNLAVAKERRELANKLVYTQQAQTIGRQAVSHLFVPDALQYN